MNNILTKRDVAIVFPAAFSGGNRLELPIVDSIKIKHAVAIGKIFGLTRNVMQPWHAELVEITITGSSYIGAFQNIINKKTNKEENLYAHQNYGEEGPVFNTWNDITNYFLQYQNDLADINYLYTNYPLTLYIANEPGQPYSGFIENIDGGENISKPFIIDYTINFIGISSSSYNKTSAQKTAEQDSAKQLQIRQTQLSSVQVLVVPQS